jgi:type IV secretion system protein VirD4
MRGSLSASAAKKIWKNENERYVGSILATIDSYLNVYADPNVAAAVESCEFAPEDLVCGPNPVLLNLHLPPEHSERLSPLVRMLTSQILNSVMGHQDKVNGHWKRHTLLFALDEFNRFGRVDAIEGAMADMRSYHCRAMLGAQSDGVLAAIYGEKSLIFNNSRLVALRPFDSVEAEKISKAVGFVEVTVESDSASYGTVGDRRGAGLSRTKMRKPILPQEAVLRLSENDVLVFGYEKPIRVRRPPLSSWRTLVNPVPRSWSSLDCELLPVRDDNGQFLDLPQAVGERNPWDKIRFQEPPPEPETVEVEEPKKPKKTVPKPKQEKREKAAPVTPADPVEPVTDDFPLMG